MADFYQNGSAVRLSAAFTQFGTGTPTDPLTITLVYEDPSGTVTTLVYGSSSIARDGVGLYHNDMVVNLVGVWTYRWSGTFTVGAAVSEGSFTVGGTTT